MVKDAECAVCVILRDDHSTKPVYYCCSCDEWMCHICWTDVGQRGLAMLKQKFGRLLSRLKGGR